MGMYEYIYYIIIIKLINGVCLFRGQEDGILLLCFVGACQHDFYDSAHPSHPKIVCRHTLLRNASRVLSFLKLAPFHVRTFAFVLLFNGTAHV